MSVSRIIAVAVVLLLLGGCASSPFGTSMSGGANYSYAKTPENGCVITINSARDISGAGLKIGKDCTVDVSASAAGGGGAFNAINELIKRVPVGE